MWQHGFYFNVSRICFITCLTFSVSLSVTICDSVLYLEIVLFSNKWATVSAFLSGTGKLLANNYTNQQIPLYICNFKEFYDIILKHLNHNFPKGWGDHLLPVGVVLSSKIWGLTSYSIIYILITFLVHARPIICTFNCIMGLLYPYMATVMMIF